MSTMGTQITSLAIVYSSAYSGVDQRKYQSFVSLAIVRGGIHRWPVNSPHKRPVTRKMFPFDDVIMGFLSPIGCSLFQDGKSQVLETAGCLTLVRMGSLRFPGFNHFKCGGSKFKWYCLVWSICTNNQCIKKKYVSICSQCCTYRWTCNTRCRGICENIAFTIMGLK